MNIFFIEFWRLRGLIFIFWHSSIGRAVIDYGGEEPAKASLLKVIGNTFIINMIEGLAQGHVLAQKTGLGSANLEKFLEVVFPGPYMIHSKRMSSGAYYKEPVISPSRYVPPLNSPANRSYKAHR